MGLTKAELFKRENDATGKEVQMPVYKPWQNEPAAVCKKYGVVQATGLSTAQVEERREEFGENKLDEEEPQSLLALVIEQFEDILVQVLLGAAVLSFVLAFFEEVECETLADGSKVCESQFNAFVEPAVILLILIINAFVGVWQESNASKALEALKQMQALHTPTWRNGELIDELPTIELVPGDIVVIKVGDKVPADCRFLEMDSRTYSTDQSALTGESKTVQKETAAIQTDEDTPQAKTNMAFAGTTIASGSGTFVITATGMTTEIGLIQESVQESKEEEGKTPLGEKLDEFGNMLTNVITAICLLVWIMSYQKFFTEDGDLLREVHLLP